MILDNIFYIHKIKKKNCFTTLILNKSGTTNLKKKKTAYLLDCKFGFNRNIASCHTYFTNIFE